MLKKIYTFSNFPDIDDKRDLAEESSSDSMDWDKGGNATEDWDGIPAIIFILFRDRYQLPPPFGPGATNYFFT